MYLVVLVGVCHGQILYPMYEVSTDGGQKMLEDLTAVRALIVLVTMWLLIVPPLFLKGFARTWLTLTGLALGVLLWVKVL